MRTISKNRILRALSLGILALTAGIGHVSAQDPAQPPSKSGFIRLVHACAQGEGKLNVDVDGKSVNKNGYDFSDCTGAIPLKPGSHKIKFSRTGVKDGTTTVNIVANETTTLIPFAEKVPASDTEPAYWTIRVLRLKQKDTQNGRSVTFVSVSKEPELTVDVLSSKGNWVSYQVKRLATTQGILDYSEGFNPLRYKDKMLQSIPILSAGNYVVVLYDTPEGKLSSVNFKDYRFLSEE
jgi:hypothetical protein